MKTPQKTLVLVSPLWLENHREHAFAKRIRAHRRQRWLFLFVMLPSFIAAVAFLIYSIATN